jgi:hypothetical protein
VRFRPELAINLLYSQVKDDKGRRRLHGAFTGGFSAGYFNTVGSKEGSSPVYTACGQRLNHRCRMGSLQFCVFPLRPG